MADHSITDAAHDLIPKLRDFARHPDTTPELRVQVNVLAERLEVLISGTAPRPVLHARPDNGEFCRTCGKRSGHWDGCTDDRPEAS